MIPSSRLEILTQTFNQSVIMKTKNRFSSIVSRLSFLSNNEQRTTNNEQRLRAFPLLPNLPSS